MSATDRNSTTPRVIYESPCGRVKVVREGPKDFALFLDRNYVRSHERSWDAEHDGGVWLHEQAGQLSADLADEQAETYDSYEDAHTPEKAAAILLADGAPSYPTSTGSDGIVDVEACERLGLGAQMKQAIIDERSDGPLIVLSGTGELLIRPAGKTPCVLDFKETAALITFMGGDNTKRLFPAILRASLLARGGKVAELVEWMDAAFERAA